MMVKMKRQRAVLVIFLIRAEKTRISRHRKNISILFSKAHVSQGQFAGTSIISQYIPKITPLTRHFPAYPGSASVRTRSSTAPSWTVSRGVFRISFCQERPPFERAAGGTHSPSCPHLCSPACSVYKASDQFALSAPTQQGPYAGLILCNVYQTGHRSANTSHPRHLLPSSNAPFRCHQRKDYRTSDLKRMDTIMGNKRAPCTYYLIKSCSSR